MMMGIMKMNSSSMIHPITHTKETMLTTMSEWYVKIRFKYKTNIINSINSSNHLLWFWFRRFATPILGPILGLLLFLELGRDHVVLVFHVLLFILTFITLIIILFLYLFSYFVEFFLQTVDQLLLVSSYLLWLFKCLQ